MINQTVYSSLEPILIELQRCENQIKREFIFENGWESQQMRTKRTELVQRLFDEPIQNLAEFAHRIIKEINDQYPEWAEEDDVEFEDDEDLQLGDLRQFVRTLYVSFTL
jgi:hypothetical protein